MKPTQNEREGGRQVEEKDEHKKKVKTTKCSFRDGDWTRILDFEKKIKTTQNYTVSTAEFLFIFTSSSDSLVCDCDRPNAQQDIILPVYNLLRHTKYYYK